MYYSQDGGCKRSVESNGLRYQGPVNTRQKERWPKDVKMTKERLSRLHLAGNPAARTGNVGSARRQPQPQPQSPAHQNSRDGQLEHGTLCKTNRGHCLRDRAGYEVRNMIENTKVILLTSFPGIGPGDEPGFRSFHWGKTRAYTTTRATYRMIRVRLAVPLALPKKQPHGINEVL